MTAPESLDDPSHAAIAADLRSLPDVAAPAELGRIVLAAADRAATRRTRRYVAACTVAIAAAVIIFLVARRDAAPTGPVLAVAVEVRRGDAVVRGADDLKVGDTLVVRGTWSGRGEVRIYRDDRDVVLRCSSARDPGCRGDGDVIVGEHTVTARGTYRAVVFEGDLPRTGTLEQVLQIHRGARAIAQAVEVQ